MLSNLLMGTGSIVARSPFIQGAIGTMARMGGDILGSLGEDVGSSTLGIDGFLNRGATHIESAGRGFLDGTIGKMITGGIDKIKGIFSKILGFRDDKEEDDPLADKDGDGVPDVLEKDGEATLDPNF